LEEAQLYPNAESEKVTDGYAVIQAPAALDRLNSSNLGISKLNAIAGLTQET